MCPAFFYIEIESGFEFFVFRAFRGHMVVAFGGPCFCAAVVGSREREFVVRPDKACPERSGMRVRQHPREMQ
jgi:hypothetical protein